MSGRFGYRRTIQTNANGVQTRLGEGEPYMAPVMVLRSATVSAAGATTYTAGQVVGGLIVRTDTTGARTDTLPAAAALVAQLRGAYAGLTTRCILRNAGDYAITLAGGGGVTLATAVVVPRYRTFELLLVVNSIAPGSEALTVLSLN
jgi:hypothetical protein